jgi:hypothetical protein
LDRFEEPLPVLPACKAVRELGYSGVEADTVEDVAEWFARAENDLVNAETNARRMVNFLDNYFVEQKCLTLDDVLEHYRTKPCLLELLRYTMNFCKVHEFESMMEKYRFSSGNVDDFYQEFPSLTQLKKQNELSVGYMWQLFQDE